MTCYFIGHRNAPQTTEFISKIKKEIHQLISQGCTIFLFGDHSVFNSLCYDIVTELKNEYPNINRIHYRTAYENPDNYTNELLSIGYEASVCPSGVSLSGKAAYIKRNIAMINDSDICVFYYDKRYQPIRRKNTENINHQPQSGTKLAFEYALKSKKTIINILG